MAKTVVVMFDTRNDAEIAAERLMDAGFDRREIDIRSEAAAPTTARTSDENGSWWDWLFGESDERSYYKEGIERGGAVLTVNATTDDRAERARDLLEDSGAEFESGGAELRDNTRRATEMTSRVTETTAAAMPPSGAVPMTPGARQHDSEVIPVVEERLKVGKRAVARGGVRVYTRVTEQPIEEDVRLREERVRVERRPTDRAVTAADEAFRDRTVEFTESAEEVVVSKEARVVEEVFVGKEAEERVEKVRETVRRTDVDVQNLDADDEADYRRHWTQTAQAGGRPFEDYRDAYRYGHTLSSDARYAGRDWASVEADARRDWELRSPGTWESVKDSIRYAWDRMRGRGRRAA